MTLQMSLSWPLAWLWIFWTPLSAVATTTVPAPISVDPSERFEGNDGPWSTFAIRVGTPAQDVRVLVAMASQETWVVSPGGCVAGEPNDCQTLRGGTFNLNTSSTWLPTKDIWNNTGIYVLSNEIGNYLGNDATGEYGFDTVGLSWSGTGPTLNRTIVASFIDTSYYLGEFGISPRSTNFTVTNDNSSALDDPQPSYLSLLKQNNYIPSVSWGYQTGSYYRSQSYPNAYGSLVLGGFDTGRFTGSPLSMNMGTDQGRELLVGIQGIAFDDTSTSSSLLQTPILAALDSTQADIWLPLDTCQLFEEAFGIMWNDTAQMYLLNDTVHNALLAQDPSVSFKLGSSTSGGSTLSITLPYGAFDLTADYPLVANSTLYFPLKRAANSTQFTLGRAFMQEAYIWADYERYNFSLAQAQWPPATPHLIAIQPLATTNNTSRSNLSSGLSDGVISGIVVAIVAVVLIAIGVGAVLAIRKRRRKGYPTSPPNSDEDPAAAHSHHALNQIELEDTGARRTEMDALESQKAQLDAIDSMVKPLVEMPADMAGELPAEMPAQEVRLKLAASALAGEMPGRFESDGG